MFWPEPTTTIAPASGAPVSAPVTRPVTRIAGCKAGSDAFGFPWRRSGQPSHWRANRGALDLQAELDPAPDPREPEPAFRVADDRGGPHLLQESSAPFPEVDPVIAAPV